MNRTTIETMLKPFTESISDGSLSTLSAIRLHLSLLIEIRKIGVSIPLILEISGCSYSPSTFSDKLSKLKKTSQQCESNNNATTVSKSFESVSIASKSKTSKVEAKLHSNLNKSNYSDEEWIKAFSFTTSFHPRALMTIIPTLEKAGWNPDNYHLLKNEFTILTFSQLVNVVGNISSNRFRKIIFNDGNPIF